MDAKGLSAIDCTDVLTGNADLADSCAWQPPGEPENPGHLCTEHTRAIAMPWLTERRADLIFVGLAVVGICMGVVS